MSSRPVARRAAVSPLVAVTTAGMSIALLVGCDAAAPAIYVERSDSAGVEIVTNHGGDRPLDWQFERAFTLGGADAGPESFYDVVPAAIQANEAGKLYVLDRGNHRVLVFDGDGRHLRAVGREGSGPGEFRLPRAMAVTGEGELAVADIGYRGLVRLTPTGEPIDQQVVEDWRGGRIATFSDGMVVQTEHHSDDEEWTGLTYLVGTERHLLVASEPTRVAPADFGCVRFAGLAPLFAPSLAWDARENRIAAVTGPGYDIQIHDEHGRVVRVRRELPPRPATRGLAMQEVGEAYDAWLGGGCPVSPDRVVDARGFAEVLPAVRRLALAPDGTLWVLRFAVKGAPAPIDVFAADGEYLGTLPAETPFPDAFFPDGRIASLEKDDLDVDHVAVWSRVPRPGATLGAPGGVY